ncbi:recombinase family protein [Desulfosporosinus acidiphilus]|uniref:recombinase family protein n=1 Tax=Desulfosporosinus acidiphilus TaxID=885581 RepID=UPI001A9A61BD|nr:recombinase family protein [Desulfosporosinus acidiphilus]
MRSGKNTFGRPGFQRMLEDCHPAIISEEKFDRVQAEKSRRSNIETDGVKRKSAHCSMKKG